jgi:uncharacterized protein (UPF0276 family)
MSIVRPDRAVSGFRPIPLDVGIGLCPEHHALMLDRQPAVAWFEVQAGPLLTRGDWLRAVESVARDYPLSVHAAGLSLGSVVRPDAAHLCRLRELVTRLQPDFVSDHLCWSAADDRPLADLRSVIRNITHVQDTLQRQILLQIPSTTRHLPEPALSEEAFLAEVILRTGCGIVLDWGNLHCRAISHGMSADALLEDFLAAIEPRSIAEIHLAGRGWELFESAVAALGPVPTLLEWDMSAPDFGVLQAEAASAQSILLQSAPGSHVAGF